MDWAMMIAYYRKQMEKEKGTPIHEKYAHFADCYDVIVGYIANDRMYTELARFFNGTITDVALSYLIRLRFIIGKLVCRLKIMEQEVHFVDALIHMPMPAKPCLVIEGVLDFFKPTFCTCIDGDLVDEGQKYFRSAIFETSGIGVRKSPFTDSEFQRGQNQRYQRKF